MKGYVTIVFHGLIYSHTDVFFTNATTGLAKKDLKSLTLLMVHDISTKNHPMKVSYMYV